MNEHLAEILERADEIKNAAEKLNEREELDRQDFEATMTQRLGEEARAWQRSFDELVEKVEDFERGIITREELLAATR